MAAVFAIHPLRVQSVAWVAERKDVMSGLLFMLTLWLYARYAERPASWGRYLLVVASFALGLTAKPMLVTLPFVLLLLDYWPLGRLGPPREDSQEGAATPPREKGDRHHLCEAPSGPFRQMVPVTFFPPKIVQGHLVRLVVEKIPLFVLAAASCVVTLAANRNTMKPLEQPAILCRVAHAAVAYVAYLGKMIYPAGLAIPYPLPKGPPPVWETVAAVALLLAISTAVFAARRQCPYLLFGWLWYLGTLVPVIGLVQVGCEGMADRFTYLTQIGLYVAVAWGAVHVAGCWPSCRRPLAAVAVLVVVVLMGCAWQQTHYWRDSETLWKHTLECVPRNPIAHYNLGLACADCGQVDEAIKHYQKALDFNSGYVEAHNNLGNVLAGLGQIDKAIAQYRTALEINPDYANAHYNLGLALAGRGHIDEAIEHYRRAVEINPDYLEAHNNLGSVLAARGQVDEAIEHYRKALKIRPDAISHNNLGSALAGCGQVDEAIAQYREALKIKPDYAEAHYNLGNALAGCGHLDEAIVHYRKALELRPDDPIAQNNLASALVGRGQVDEAITHYREALKLKPDYLEAHYNLGLALAGCGHLDEAIKHYRTALRLATARNDRALADAIRAQIRLQQSIAPAGKCLSEPGPPALG